jgi:hypothetical protein
MAIAVYSSDAASGAAAALDFFAAPLFAFALAAGFFCSALESAAPRISPRLAPLSLEPYSSIER